MCYYIIRNDIPFSRYCCSLPVAARRVERETNYTIRNAQNSDTVDSIVIIITKYNTYYYKHDLNPLLTMSFKIHIM